MASRGPRVAAIQMNSQADVAQNLERARALAASAVDAGAEVLVFPENFAFFGPDAARTAFAEDFETEAGPIRAALAEIAFQHGAWVVAGGMPESAGGGRPAYNSSLVLNPRGEVTAAYRKVHLFDVELSDGATYRESEHTTGGTEPVVTEIAGVKTGLSICYDVRFPELYRVHSAKGAELILVPAAFTLLTGKDHWHVLLRARAIESQCFVVAAAQWGKHPEGKRTFGKSCIIDPWGEVIAQASEGEGFAVARLDMEILSRVRKSLPALEHRRL